LPETLPKILPPAIAYLLVSHGSRDPRPQTAAAQLATRLGELLHPAAAMNFGDTFAVANAPTGLSAPPISAISPVGTAQLEFAASPLHQQIVEFSRSQFGQHPEQRSLANSPGETAAPRLVVLPLFLLPGVHVMEDLPAEIALAQQIVGAAVEITVRPYLGTQTGLRRLVREQMATRPMEAWILLAHGSRRAQGNQPIAAIATDLGAVPAYWSVSPTLEERLPELIQLGCQKIGILPYFLFSGGITDAIAQSMAAIAQRFPDLTLYQATPLDSSPALVDVLLEMVQPL
jgi:sirohydrochlorin cobaltochelatase